MKPWTLAGSLLLGTSLALGAAGSGIAQQAQQEMGAQEEELQTGETTQPGMAAGQEMQTGGMAGPMGLDAETIRELQQALNEAGHDIQVDGIWGPETQSAVREFQQDQGIEATGEPDEQTFAMLGLDPMQIRTDPGVGMQQEEPFGAEEPFEAEEPFGVEEQPATTQ